MYVCLQTPAQRGWSPPFPSRVGDWESAPRSTRPGAEWDEPNNFALIPGPIRRREEGQAVGESEVGEISPRDGPGHQAAIGADVDRGGDRSRSGVGRGLAPGPDDRQRRGHLVRPLEPRDEGPHDQGRGDERGGGVEREVDDVGDDPVVVVSDHPVTQLEAASGLQRDPRDDRLDPDSRQGPAGLAFEPSEDQDDRGSEGTVERGLEVRRGHRSEVVRHGAVGQDDRADGQVAGVPLVVEDRASPGPTRWSPTARIATRTLR